jgi:hypothetical protein
MTTKLDLVDHVITLHNIARQVEIEFSDNNLSADIRNCADRLHVLAVGVRISEVQANDVIKKAKE